MRLRTYFRGKEGLVGWLKPLSAPPPFSTTSSFLTFTPFSPPPIGYVKQTGLGTNYRTTFRRRYAEPVRLDQ